jgi:hypothetical protein
VASTSCIVARGAFLRLEEHMRSILLTLVDAAAWILLPLALALLVGTTAGRPGRPEKDDMMPHGEMMKWMQ